MGRWQGGRASASGCSTGPPCVGQGGRHDVRERLRPRSLAVRAGGDGRYRSHWVPNRDGVRTRLTASVHWFFCVHPLCRHCDPSQPEPPVRASKWVYAEEAVSRSAHYTGPTTTQIPPNFPSGPCPVTGRLLEGGVVHQELQRDVEGTMGSISSFMQIELLIRRPTTSSTSTIRPAATVRSGTSPRMSSEIYTQHPPITRNCPKSWST
jgi:hypothetical protein